MDGGWRSPRNFGARTAVGLSITLVGSRGKTTLEYPFRAPMEALRTPAACWTARKTSREDTRILGPASCVARRGREECGLSTRRSWLEGYLWTDMGKVGGGERCPAVRHPRSAAHLRSGVSQLCDDWHLRYVRAHVTCTRKELNHLVLAMLPILRCAGSASRGIPRFFPTEGMGNGGRPISYAVRCVRHQTAGFPTPTSKSKNLHRTSRPTLSSRPRR